MSLIQRSEIYTQDDQDGLVIKTCINELVPPSTWKPMRKFCVVHCEEIHRQFFVYFTHFKWILPQQGVLNNYWLGKSLSNLQNHVRSAKCFDIFFLKIPDRIYVNNMTPAYINALKKIYLVKNERKKSLLCILIIILFAIWKKFTFLIIITSLWIDQIVRKFWNYSSVFQVAIMHLGWWKTTFFLL